MEKWKIRIREWVVLRAACAWRKLIAFATALRRRCRAFLCGNRGCGYPAALRWAAMVALVAVLGMASVRARGRLATMESRWEGDNLTAAAVQPTEPSPTPTAEPARWTWPVRGEVVGVYSPGEPVWSETLGQWQTHDGVDIAAAPGESVTACGDGVVEDAWRDVLWGNVIVVDHGDGLRSTYASLNTLELVQPGDSVKLGEVISAVGRSADCECDLGWHIHFALHRDGIPVNFASMAGGLP